MKKKTTRIISLILLLAIVFTLVISADISVFASELNTESSNDLDSKQDSKDITNKNIVTVGANLSNEQRYLIYNYFNIVEDNTRIVEVTNDEEHKYLDGIATDSQIGTHTYSCTYIEQTESGGIHIKTTNINWVTGDMIRNALVTSGVKNCNIICASPIEVSGTGALTGIFKYYNEISDTKLDEEKTKLASAELIETAGLANSLGSEDATKLVEAVKEIVITDDLNTKADILKEINNYDKENKLSLTDKQKESLVNLMLSISKQNYDYDDIQNAYTSTMDSVNKLQEKINESMNILDKIASFLNDLIAKLTGTYEDKKDEHRTELAKEQLGIISETNDSLLGANTKVTTTEDNKLLAKIDSYNKEKETEDNDSVMDKVANFFKNTLGFNKEDSVSVDKDKSDTTVTFDTVDNSPQVTTSQNKDKHVCADNLDIIREEQPDNNGDVWGTAQCKICHKEYKILNGKIATPEDLEKYDNTKAEEDKAEENKAEENKAEEDKNKVLSHVTYEMQDDNYRSKSETLDEVVNSKH